MRDKIIELLNNVRKEEDRYSDLANDSIYLDDTKYLVNIAISGAYLKMRIALEDILNDEKGD